ncbi:MAG: hypothetical protein IPI33_10935 [Dehalococcoidia bacterium]|uniref:hypothetical protein n=1 Tax=Candidatus Amarobacter glycogenicus TaxID=3140699 RepID=UPI001D9E7F41|nr:hypothetical protein [Dehalococcoidia bacterium]MBK6562568.1 hypothetical protein [Dehalococcoidia bacterium]MBK7127610.1 hypothetical protein [Dehalococcoidia bacterium]MBK7330048.1 hypothetical protein [Dehalococcoidia bacterium]MBK7725721.1 hypothetical protein [Dehalococcoidia bacterium]
MSPGARLGAGVLTIVGGAIALVLGLLLALVGGALEAVYGTNGNSAGVSGVLAILFGLGAVLIAVLFFLPSKKPAVILLAFDIAGMVWAFARVDAWALALVPLVPLGVALFLGVASDGRRDTSAST